MFLLSFFQELVATEGNIYVPLEHYADLADYINIFAGLTTFVVAIRLSRLLRLHYRCAMITDIIARSASILASFACDIVFTPFLYHFYRFLTFVLLMAYAELFQFVIG